MSKLRTAKKCVIEMVRSKCPYCDHWQVSNEYEISGGVIDCTECGKQYKIKVSNE